MTARKTAGVCALAIATVMVWSSPSAAQTAPTLSVQVVGSQVSAQWSPVSQSQGYTLFVGSTAGGSDIGTVNLPASITSFSVTAPAGVYYIRVRGFAGALVGDFSNEVVAAVGQVSTTPTLSHTVVGTQVTLQWTPVPGAQGYTMAVGSTSGASDMIVQNLPASPTSLSVNAPPGVYYVRVRAFAGNIAGSFSNEEVVTSGVAACVTAPGAPALTAAVDGGMVNLSWSGGSGATGFVIQWSTFAGGTELSEQTTSSTHSKYVGMVGTFYARVVAVSPCGSTSSNEVSFTIESIPKRYLGSGEINSVLEQVKNAYPRAWSLAHRSSSSERWDFIILASRRLFQLSGGTIGANWRRAAVGDLSMDGLSVENPADGRYYFADVICGAGGPSPSICYTTPFHDGALLRAYSGGPYAPHGFANPMLLKTSFNYGAAGGW